MEQDGEIFFQKSGNRSRWFCECLYGMNNRRIHNNSGSTFAAGPVRFALGQLFGILRRRFRAAVAELADAPGSGPGGGKTPWRFDSSQPHLFGIGVFFKHATRFCSSTPAMMFGEHASAMWQKGLGDSVRAPAFVLNRSSLACAGMRPLPAKSGLGFSSLS
jgi:hypothetical protein